MQVSGTLQESIPGPPVAAIYAAPNALVAPITWPQPVGPDHPERQRRPGRTGHDVWGRLNQVDLRVAKIFKVRGTRTALSLDLFNAFNRNTVLTVNNNFASWLQPQGILQARLTKLSVQLNS